MNKNRLLTRLTCRRLLIRGSASSPVVYLTFDDGPHGVFTPKLLDLLAEYSVRVTFFLVGREVRKHRALIERMVRMGHEIGNHSLAHLRMDRLSGRARTHEIVGMNTLLRDYDQSPTHIFRPPYGGMSVGLLRHCLTRGVRVALWSRDSMDYKGDGPAVVAGFRNKDIENGDIILFHDDGPTSVETLAILLPEWISRGFEFRPLRDFS